MKTLKEYTALVENALQAMFPPRVDDSLRLGEIPPLLYDSMRYSLLAGGKRLRGAMVLAAADMLSGEYEQVITVACAVEMIHASSLIHDDLPGMDDDTMRRGKPTNHVVYGEGQAILAGDGLLNMAHEVMLEKAKEYPGNALNHLRAIYEISRGAGVTGMMGGQCVDLDSEKKGLANEEILRFIHVGKTSAMFSHPLRAAAILSGADDKQIEAIGEYGQNFGRLFQVVDDILDVEGDESALGKSIGKDEKSGKLTAVSLLGLAGAKQLRDELSQNAVNALSIFGQRAAFFVELVASMKERRM